MKTIHHIIFDNAADMAVIPSDSVDLVVTSPPYPMIKMWDETFCEQNASVRKALDRGNGMIAFELMHNALAPVWDEIFRVLKHGGFACINIGDATRTLDEEFRLYPNHAKIVQYLMRLGFSVLPDILWRKQTNAPNKFMGSGVLPAGAYVTLEHEYILILRKGGKRIFENDAEKRNRRESAIFWEERNLFFSDVWTDIKGTSQVLDNHEARMRSGAYPFELAHRLISMYSVKGDMVLDPFLGTGTTTAAAMATGRDSIGFEIDPNLRDPVHAVTRTIVRAANEHISQRLRKHADFVENRLQTKGPTKHTNIHYGFPVVTNQEKELILNELKEVGKKGEDTFEVSYSEG